MQGGLKRLASCAARQPRAAAAREHLTELVERELQELGGVLAVCAHRSGRELAHGARRRQQPHTMERLEQRDGRQTSRRLKLGVLCSFALVALALALARAETRAVPARSGAGGAGGGGRV